MSKNKKITIQIEKKPLRKGHQTHRSGAGTHDSRPKRLRTRNNQQKRAIENYS